jgi:hypothetical protein
MTQRLYNNLQDASGTPNSSSSMSLLTVGRVLDTNDPLQMGRVRVHCPGYGDSPEKVVGSIPWAVQVSPLMGVVGEGVRGSENSEVAGAVAYGMWNIPSVGAYVLTGCIDGDQNRRFWLGCLAPNYLAHTMPHGRYDYVGKANGAPDGPLDSAEQPIEPLYSNFTKAFTKTNDSVPGTPSDPRRNLEWRTRGVDTQVSANSEGAVQNGKTVSKTPDHKMGSFSYTSVVEENGNTRVAEGQGYGLSMEFPNRVMLDTGGINYDSQVYSWTTPGFHSISMDDHDWNCRTRIRTTSGHQIIMDDTNERIYISTAGGNTWIEMDKVGNIDVFAERNISFHGKGDINFTTDQAFRVTAHEGIHLHSNKDIRTTSVTDTNIQVGESLKVHSKATLYIQSDSDMHLRSSDSFRILSSGSTVNIRSSGNTLITGAEIHLNGPDAAPANNAEEKSAFMTSRVPEHEPWARVFMNPANSDGDGPTVGGAQNSHVAEHSYTDLNVGKQSSRPKDSYKRGPLWHR